ncbi:MAG: aminoglycoside phosphotransferase family protein [Bacilli bacterium]|nr:aminoglycoside phosphotransferase family protein [Bacilli bacterium]
MENKFARGRSSEIFMLEDGRVLKLFFPDYSKAETEKEFKNTQIASVCGCTETKIYEMVEKDGRAGFIMDFIDGISQNDMPTKKPFYIFKGGKDLARCHALVHSKKSHDLDDIRTEAVKMIESEPFTIFTPEERTKMKNYLMSLPEEDTIIHLDFHTGNVLVDKNGKCTVIDWMTAARGNRAIEYAMMEFLFSDAELFPGASKAQLAFYKAVRRMIGKQYYNLYQKLMPLKKEDIDQYRMVALIVRRSWNIEFEKENLANQIRGLIKKYCNED